MFNILPICCSFDIWENRQGLSSDYVSETVVLFAYLLIVYVFFMSIFL